ncbi:MAG: hypothetical protein CBE00_05860 [Planctomycetaceae bacterium TMED240]|nr:hypothetical protein [Rhodopirellula sp.]OUX07267.1 MAG: hypothetical protein CBE00_05860 [Planctomycetaceae bacterium TMED240]
MGRGCTDGNASRQRANAESANNKTLDGQSSPPTTCKVISNSANDYANLKNFSPTLEHHAMLDRNCQHCICRAASNHCEIAYPPCRTAMPHSHAAQRDVLMD